MRITSFGQMVDLERGGAMGFQLSVRSDTGELFSVPTDEKTVKRLIEITKITTPQRAPVFTQDEVDAQRRALQQEIERENVQWSARQQEESEELEDADYFGGDVDPGEVSAAREPVLGTIAEDRVAEEEPTPPTLGQPNKSPPMQKAVAVPAVRVDADGFVLPVRSRTVPKDEMGYPITNQTARTMPQDDGQDGTQI